MNHRKSSASAGQIEDYLDAVNLELQHIEFAMARLRKCTQLLLSINASSASDLSPLEQMYENLERAIRPSVPKDRIERAELTDRTERTTSRDAAQMHTHTQHDTPAARPRVALLPSRGHTPTELPLQIVKAPPRSGATSAAAR